MNCNLTIFASTVEGIYNFATLNKSSFIYIWLSAFTYIFIFLNFFTPSPSSPHPSTIPILQDSLFPLHLHFPSSPLLPFFSFFFLFFFFFALCALIFFLFCSLFVSHFFFLTWFAFEPSSAHVTFTRSDSNDLSYYLPLFLSILISVHPASVKRLTVKRKPAQRWCFRITEMESVAVLLNEKPYGVKWGTNEKNTFYLSDGS